EREGHDRGERAAAATRSAAGAAAARGRVLTLVNGGGSVARMDREEPLSREARRRPSSLYGMSILGACALIVGCSGSPVPADASTTPRTDDAAAPADASGQGRDISVPAVEDVVSSDVTGPGVDVSSRADVVAAADGAPTRRCAGSYTVRSDAELGELRGCSEIEGSLDVRGPVSTLEPLSSLTRVGGSLEVRNLPSHACPVKG
ncbi:MAG: hypothetical protein SFX72_01200, partial [Isosphaeraceae bacterium]|nr:hypothetical protein [Isosphaeraceae bacterium]